jgi:peroxiredoxin-like protein
MSQTLKHQHLFDASITWLHEKKGLLTSGDTTGSIQVETPAAFGGKGKSWSPEHLLLGAVSSCFMTTYLSFADKFKFKVEGLTCAVKGTVELVDGRFAFTKIDLFPDIVVSDESDLEKARLAMQKAHKYCIIGNSLNCELIYHDELKVMQAVM